MKKFIAGLIIGFILASGVAVGAAAGVLFAPSEIELYAYGQKVDTQLYMYGGMAYTQVSTVAKAFDLDRTFDGKKLSFTRKLTNLETVMKNCKNSCVMIYAYKNNDIDMQGSGFIYKGYIVTAKHVIEGADKIGVFLDDSIDGMYATVHYEDSNLDVAILKADTKMPSVTLGDSSKLIEGEKLVSITSPNGAQNFLDECVYAGMEYNSGGDLLGIVETYMSGGSSGGAVFNYNSEVVGMAAMGETGFISAIPINNIKPILEKLK